MCLLTGGISLACTASIGGVSRLWLANYDDIVTGSWSDSNADNILDTVDMGQVDVTAVTNANPAVVTTASAHGFTTGDTVWLIGTSGMSGLVGEHEVGATTSTTFELVGFNSTSLAAFTGSSVQAVPRPFFEVRTKDNVIAPGSTHKVTGGNYFVHSLSFSITNQGAVANEFMQQLSLGKFVAIVLTKNGTYEILGRNNGLSAREDDQIVYTGGPTAADYTKTFTLTGDELVPLEEVTLVDIPMFNT